VLAGFDFPNGLPSSYGARTGAVDFCAALLHFGTGRWDRFYDVAEKADDICLERPFYPMRSDSTAKQSHLLAAHGVGSIDELRRQCERRSMDRRAACSLFWTLGGNQVGKAAITGWNEIVRPACERGAKLWPFDGDLTELAGSEGLVIAETYPAEAYGHVGARFSRSESKRRQRDRADKADLLIDWAARCEVSLVPDMLSDMQDGFGNQAVGEDRFDAAMGLLGMIEVVTGRRANAIPNDAGIRQWEGWILGQSI
jgi:hypothetical protein